jgi:hypothetical protein
MKTLIIYPKSTVEQDSPFYLIDPDTGEALCSHFCSHSRFAPGDLYHNQEERKKEFKEKYNDDIEVKFIDKTDYSWDEIYRKNQELKMLKK